MRLEVHAYDASRKQDWDELVRRARAPHFLFLRDYMEYHSDRFADFSAVVYEGGRALAALPASRDGDTVSSHGGLTFGGFVTDRTMTAGRMLGVFDAVCRFMGEHGVRRFVYKPVPHIYHAVPAEEDLYALFRHGAGLARRDLSATIATAQRLPYRKSRKWSVKRSRTASLQVGRGFAFHEFAEVLRTALERHGAKPTHTGHELELLAGRFPDNIKLFEARSGGELAAGVVVYETERVAHTQYIAATEHGRDAAAVDRIVDWLLEQVYCDTPWFDFGISTTNDGRTLNEGLARQKESFGARAIAYDRYELEIA